MEIGDKVVLIEGWLHYMNDSVYPVYGTKGTVTRVGVDPAENPEQIVKLVGTGSMVEVRWADTKQSCLLFESQLQHASLPLPEDKFHKGDTVRFIDQQAHEQYPQFYPEVGTKGVIDSVCAVDEFGVRWEDNTTSLADTWMVHSHMIELVQEEPTKKGRKTGWRKKEKS